MIDLNNPYIIAEAGSNHNGNIELAKRMITEAKKSGADCIKFQSWTKNSIFSRKSYENNIKLEKEAKKYSLNENELMQLKRHADKEKIDFASTPFSKEEVDFLVNKIKPPFIKIASMDLDNYPFIKYIASKGLPIIISTGLSNINEINKAIQTIEKTGNKNITILHCVSKYPPEDKDLNLNRIMELKRLFPYSIGFSDHTTGTIMPLIAIAKGACVIEKHFTLTKEMYGWEHHISVDKNELKTICAEAKRIRIALGSFDIKRTESRQSKNVFRRSIVAKKMIKKGQVITREDIDFKRPGTGIPPGQYEKVIGKEALKNITNDSLIFLEDLK